MSREPVNEDAYRDEAANKHEHIAWSLDPREGVVQGPLDLAYLRKCSYRLLLKEGQIALLSVRGKAASVFFSGTHLMEVGSDSVSLPGDGLLYFLHMDQPLVIPWRQHMPILPSAAWDREARHARGTFSVQVTNPVAFHKSFLRDRSGEGEEICRDALSHLLPTFLAIHLSQASRNGIGKGTLAEAVANLDPAVLDDDLAAYGVACTSMTMEPVGQNEEAVLGRAD